MTNTTGGTTLVRLVDVTIQERHPHNVDSDTSVIRRLIHYNDGHAIWWESYTAYYSFEYDQPCSLTQGLFVQDGRGMGRMTFEELDEHDAREQHHLEASMDRALTLTDSEQFAGNLPYDLPF